MMENRFYGAAAKASERWILCLLALIVPAEIFS